MASPWKLLARLVSHRRHQRQEHSSADDVKPDVLAIARPIETVGDEGLNAADPAVDEKLHLRHQSEVLSADPDHAEESASGVHGTVDIEGANLKETTDPALSDETDTAAHDATKPLQTREVAERKRSRPSKKAERVEGISPPSPAVLTNSNDAISLDEEIRLLRNQLARRLQLQNSQLKKMLERFER